MATEIVEVVLTNEFAYIVEASDEAYAAVDEFWSYRQKGYIFAPRYRTGDWDGRIKMMRQGRVPAGLFRATRKEAHEKLGIKFRVRYDLPKPVQAKFPTEPVGDAKYKFQDECIVAMTGAVHRGGGIILSATGTGKTAMAGKFFRRMTEGCLFVVDELGLLYQSKKELAEWAGEDVGIVGNSKFVPRRITVATIQTLHKHQGDRVFRAWFSKVKIVIVDELHEQLSRRNFKVLETINPIARFGLTATLQLRRKEIRTRAFAFAGPVLYEFPLKQGVEQGVLAKGRVLQLLFDGSKTGELDYHQEYLEHVVENEEKLAATVKIIRYLIREDRHVIALADRPVHVKVLHSMLDDIPHRLAYGAIDPERRVRSRKRFDKGDLRLIIANRVFKKGINVKRVDCIIDVAELKSQNDCKQKFGRGVRLHPDKDELLYIDIGTNGDGNNRYASAARSRARSLRQLGVPVKTVKVDGIAEALTAVRKELAAITGKK